MTYRLFLNLTRKLYQLDQKTISFRLRKLTNNKSPNSPRTKSTRKCSPKSRKQGNRKWQKAYVPHRTDTHYTTKKQTRKEKHPFRICTNVFISVKTLHVTTVDPFRPRLQFLPFFCWFVDFLGSFLSCRKPKFSVGKVVKRKFSETKINWNRKISRNFLSFDLESTHTIAVCIVCSVLYAVGWLVTRSVGGTNKFFINQIYHSSNKTTIW